jgi:HEAT repeat protein
MLGSAMTEPALQVILLDSLDLRTPEDQIIILSGIAEQEITSAEASVIALLSSADQAVRKQAIFTLGVIGGSASFSTLYAMFLNESDEDAGKALAKLDLATMDNELFETVEESSDLKQRSAAMQLLALRNAEGAAELFNRTIAPGNPDDLRVECMKALEVLGTVESCQAMAQFIVLGDSVKRPAQKSLKRLCLNYGDPDLLWDSVFVPALKAAGNDAIRGDLLVIADAVAGDKLLAYIQQQIADTGSSLRPAALKTLQRWPHMEASEVWFELISRPNVSASDIKAAQSGLGRMVKSKEVGGWDKLKLNQIVIAVEKAPTAEFKQAMVNLYLKPDDYIQHYLHDAFEQFANDPDISFEVAAVLATVSESKVRRKR